jgi:hypothetical protein
MPHTSSWRVALRRTMCVLARAYPRALAKPLWHPQGLRGPEAFRGRPSPRNGDAFRSTIASKGDSTRPRGISKSLKRDGPAPCTPVSQLG